MVKQPDTLRDLGRFKRSAAAALMPPSRTGSRQSPAPRAAPCRVRAGGSGKGGIPPGPSAATAGEPTLFSAPRWKRYSQLPLPAPRPHLGKRGQYEAPPKSGRQAGREPVASSIVPPSSPHGAGPQTRNSRPPAPPGPHAPLPPPNFPPQGRGAPRALTSRQRAAGGVPAPGPPRRARSPARPPPPVPEGGREGAAPPSSAAEPRVGSAPRRCRSAPSCGRDPRPTEPPYPAALSRLLPGPSPHPRRGRERRGPFPSAAGVNRTLAPPAPPNSWCFPPAPPRSPSRQTDRRAKIQPRKNAASGRQ